MTSTSKRIETAKTIQVNRRNYRRARDRALARLAGIYKEDYLRLLNEERENDAKNGKNWLDITGRTHLDTALDRAVHGAYSGNTDRQEASADGGDGQ